MIVTFVARLGPCEVDPHYLHSLFLVVFACNLSPPLSQSYDYLHTGTQVKTGQRDTAECLRRKQSCRDCTCVARYRCRANYDENGEWEHNGIGMTVKAVCQVRFNVKIRLCVNIIRVSARYLA